MKEGKQQHRHPKETEANTLDWFSAPLSSRHAILPITLRGIVHIVFQLRPGCLQVVDYNQNQQGASLEP